MMPVIPPIVPDNNTITSRITLKAVKEKPFIIMLIIILIIKSIPPFIIPQRYPFSCSFFAVYREPKKLPTPRLKEERGKAMLSEKSPRVKIRADTSIIMNVIINERITPTVTAADFELFGLSEKTLCIKNTSLNNDLINHIPEKCL